MSDKLDTELQAIEAQLTNLTAAPIPEEMIARMEKAMRNWEIHLPSEENIVPFNESVIVPASQKPSFFSIFNTLGAAAAVVLIAATSYLFVSDKADLPNSGSAPIASQLAIEEQSSQFSHNMLNASNEGITYAGEDQKPYRVICFEYTKEVKSIDANGNTVITQEPRIETILLPIKSK